MTKMLYKTINSATHFLQKRIKMQNFPQGAEILSASVGKMYKFLEKTLK